MTAAAAPIRRLDIPVEQTQEGRGPVEHLLSLRYMPALLCFLALCLTGVLWLVTAKQLEADKAHTIASSVKDNENLARALEEHVVHTFMNADQLAWSVKQQVERRGLPDDLKAFVAERTLPESPFLVVVVADEHGNGVRHTLAPRALNIADTAHFKAAKASDTGALVIGDPIIGRLSGKWSLHAARRINKPDGSFGGVASVALDLSYFSRFYSQVKLGESGVIMLVGRDGIVRAQQGESAESIGKVMKSPDLVRHSAGEPLGSYIAPAQGVQPPRLVAYRKLGQYPLVVLVGTSVASALDRHADRRRDYVAGTSVLTVFIWLSFALLGWLMVRQRRAALLLQEATRQAESANRVKSDFLANMTHELRTPLNGIIGFADCLQEELEDESQRECARIIYSSGCTLLGLVNSVLDMAKIEAGKMQLHVAQESVRLLLDEVSALHGAVAEPKGLILAIDIDDKVPETIACDRTKLQQVLNNLLHNVVKFTDKGGITLSVRMVGRDLVLGVTDTGRGIASVMHRAIFERFHQVESNAVGLNGGTGLGLALARDLVRLMGGRMEVDSEQGRGSEFRVILPLRS